MTPATLRKLATLAQLRADRAQHALHHARAALERNMAEAAALRSAGAPRLPETGAFDPILIQLAARQDTYRHAETARLTEERRKHEAALHPVRTAAARATAQVSVLEKMQAAAQRAHAQKAERRAEHDTPPAPKGPDAQSR